MLELIKYITSHYTFINIVFIFAVVIVLICLVIASIVILYRIIKKEPVSFGAFNIGYNKSLKAHEKISMVEHELGILSAAIRVSRDINHDIVNLLNKCAEGNAENIESYFHDTFINIIKLYGEIIGDQKHNRKRLAIYIPDKEDVNKLKIFKCLGFLPGVVEDCSISLQSFEGNALINQTIFRTGNIKKEEIYITHPKYNKINSLICAPLVYKGSGFGILSIDGTKKNAFSEEDELIIGLCTSQLIIVFTLRAYYIKGLKKEVLLNARDFIAASKEEKQSMSQ